MSALAYLFTGPTAAVQSPNNGDAIGPVTTPGDLVPILARLPIAAQVKADGTLLSRTTAEVTGSSLAGPGVYGVSFARIAGTYSVQVSIRVTNPLGLCCTWFYSGDTGFGIEIVDSATQAPADLQAFGVDSVDVLITPVTPIP